MPLVLVTGPTSEPLSLADARDRLNMGTEISDTTVTALITAARQKLEKQYGLALINQTWNLVLDRFPGSGAWPYPQEVGFYGPEYYESNWRPSYGRRLQSFEIPIALAPVQSISSIGYTDTDGNPQTLDPSTYALIKGDLTSKVVLQNQEAWPSTAYAAGAVQIQFVAGFGAAATAVPQTIISAIALHVGHLRSLMAQNLFMSLDSIPGVREVRYVVGTGAADVIDVAVSALMSDYVRPSL